MGPSACNEHHCCCELRSIILPRLFISGVVSAQRRSGCPAFGPRTRAHLMRGFASSVRAFEKTTAARLHLRGTDEVALENGLNIRIGVYSVNRKVVTLL